MNKKVQHQAVLFLSNKSSEAIIEEYKLLSSSVQNIADVFFVFHKHFNEIPKEIQSSNHIVFTDDILHELGFKPLINDSLIPGSGHFPLFKFYNDYPVYDYYWLIEDDVRFCGNWRDLLTFFETNNADFIASHITRKEDDPNWPWWNSLSKNGQPPYLEWNIRSFNPVFRISRGALSFMNIQLSNGWAGHHEVVLPTLLYNNNFKIVDFGGSGSFVPTGNSNKFYTQESMHHLPVRMGNVANRLYHPVKEFHKNCIIAAVGKESLHRNWLDRNQNYDVHLIVYDDSYPHYKHDSAYISIDRGYKLKLVYRYLSEHPEYIKQYDYFFMPDDDILISHKNINQLFETMKKYSLSIAQPALFDSYYTYNILIRNKFTFLRYTNFVEMMLPCFSKEAIKKVLFTFNETNSGWGADIHWAQLLDNSERKIAIIDAVTANHTRPIQSDKKENYEDLRKYLLKYNIKKEIKEFGRIYSNALKQNYFLTDNWQELIMVENVLENIINQLEKNHWQIDDVAFINYNAELCLLLFKYYKRTGNRLFYDAMSLILQKVQNNVSIYSQDYSFSTRLAGIGFLLEIIAQNEVGDNNVNMVLEKITCKLNYYEFGTATGINKDAGVLGIGLYYLMRIGRHLPSPLQKREYENLQLILIKLQQYLYDKIKTDDVKTNKQEIAEIILFFVEYRKIEKQQIFLSHEYIQLLHNSVCCLLLKDNKFYQDSLEHAYENLLFIYSIALYYQEIGDLTRMKEMQKSALDYSEQLHEEIFNALNFQDCIKYAFIYYRFYKLFDIEHFAKLTFRTFQRVDSSHTAFLESTTTLSFDDSLSYRNLIQAGSILNSILTDDESDSIYLLSLF